MAAVSEVSARVRMGYVLVLAMAIAAGVWYTNRPVWELQNIVEVTGSVDSNVLDVTVVSGRCNGGPQLRLAEDVEQVTLSAEQNVRGDCEAIGITEVLTVELAEPLGSRRLQIEDARNGVRCTIEGSATEACV